MVLCTLAQGERSMLTQTNLIKILQTGSNKLRLVPFLWFITVPKNCLIKPEIVSHSITCSELAFQRFMHCDFRAELIIHTHIFYSPFKSHQNTTFLWAACVYPFNCLLYFINKVVKDSGVSQRIFIFFCQKSNVIYTDMLFYCVWQQQHTLCLWSLWSWIFL